MNLKTDQLTPAQLLALFCGVVLILLFSMHFHLGAELADDGAFFLRYSENMLKGEFWVWNQGEAPVWGASAPLYPLVVALPMALGVSPEAAIIGVGLALTTLSLAATTLMLGHRFGAIAGVAFLAFSALDTGMMYFAGSGLESPLTVALLAFSLWTLLYRTNGWVVGIAAGLLMVNKLDLLPVGGLLLLAHWLQDKRFPNIAVTLAAVIGLAWYGFAWWHFGAPVPNSFLTKSLHQNDHVKSIDWTWFGNFVLWAGIHKWLAGLSALAIWRKGRAQLPLLVLFGGLLLIHLTAYTVKYPFEPYNWYAMPSVFALLVGAAIGLGYVADAVERRLPQRRLMSQALAIGCVAVLVGVSYRTEMSGTASIKIFASHQEFDRAQAGRWVDANTPEGFVVLTSWGNPAYYSRRKVLDGSFLNRKFENASLIKKYRPEILILQNNSGTPMKPEFAAIKDGGYRVVKLFDKTYSAGMDYFFAVLAREDIVGQVRNIDPPLDLMPYVHDIQLGDKFGILKPQGSGTVFIHPGADTPTAFTFAAQDYLGQEGKKTLQIHGRIDPNIPADAASRGAGNVRVRILQGDKQLFDDVVKVGQPMLHTVAYSGSEPLRISVDNHGGADTDWLLLSIH